jgi:hypothetical protein
LLLFSYLLAEEDQQGCYQTFLAVGMSSSADHRAAQAEAGNVNTEAQGGAAHHQLPDNVAEQGKVIFLYK